VSHVPVERNESLLKASRSSGMRCDSKRICLGTIGLDGTYVADFRTIEDNANKVAGLRWSGRYHQVLVYLQMQH